MTEAAFQVCAICGRFLVEVVCPVCKGEVSEEDSPTCWGCIGTGTMWVCPECDREESEPEAWSDVVHLRTYITREFADIPPITLASTPPDSPNGLYKLYVEALGDKRETEEDSNG